MKTKPIPIIITLAAAFISCVISIIQRVDFSIFVGRLFVVVLVFLGMGTIIKMVLDYSFRTLEPPVPIDGEMAPEGGSPEEESTGEESEEESAEENTAESEEG